MSMISRITEILRACTRSALKRNEHSRAVGSPTGADVSVRDFLERWSSPSAGVELERFRETARRAI
jgi:hypothetical protein